jgi:hypothetical protein
MKGIEGQFIKYALIDINVRSTSCGMFNKYHIPVVSTDNKNIFKSSNLTSSQNIAILK